MAAASVSLLACQLPGRTGQVALGLRWPERRLESGSFRIKAIPAETTRIQVRISSAAGLEVDESFERDKPEHQRSDGSIFRNWTLEAGPKTIAVTARDAQGQTLASLSQGLTILAGNRQTLELDLKPAPVASPLPSPTPSPGDTSGSGNSGNSSSGGNTGGEPGTGSSAEPGTQPSPGASPGASPEPGASPNPSPSPSSHRGSGGSTGNSTQDPGITSLSADPSQLSGDGQVARLTAVVNDPDNVLTSSDYTWSCTDSTAQTCPAPVPDANDPNIAYWTAPDGFAVAGFRIAQTVFVGPYTLKLVIQGTNFGPSEATVVVGVDQGTGNVSSGSTEVGG